LRDKYLYGSKRTGLSLVQIMTELNFLVNSNRNPDKGANLFVSVPHMEGFGTFISPSDVPVLVGGGHRETKHVLNKLKEEQPEVWKKITIAEDSPVEGSQSIGDLIKAQAGDRTYWDVTWDLFFYSSLITFAGTMYLWLKHKRH